MKKYSSGYGLLEVLVSLAVISIGALGFARAQVSALQITTDAQLRTSATILLDDMVGRIQANAGEAWQGIKSGYQTGTPALNVNCLSTNGSICTGNQMAMHDLADWNALIASVFPATSNAVGIVCLDATPGNPAQACSPPAINPNPVIFTIKIFWKSWKNRGGATFDQSVVTIVEPPLQR
ncbi:MAG TPA: type IV pilus modification protein PilV [Gammaproteobacteria bacterium]|nr:type IV pilus modification protein PilV [Gammaproteobacteria bacterium]HQY22178.1 type IV pilus modification protein PilV [Gammaproteobacteria bacterium]HQZ87175.1 type IV pilus modification protein PilV [Gammaproteobacteria bacterium]HRA43181.1 type IV pilus modification protein PilV [Gammaproteobacteria bacterium]